MGSWARNSLVEKIDVEGGGSSFSRHVYGPYAQHRRGFRRGTSFVSSDCPPAVGSLASSESARSLRGLRAQVAYLQSCPPSRFLNAPMAEWREALRCMTRASWVDYSVESGGRATLALLWSLSRAEKHGSRPPIGNKRPWNSLEKMIGSPDLPSRISHTGISHRLCFSGYTAVT